MLVVIYVDYLAAVGVGGHLCRLSMLLLVLVVTYVDYLAPVGVGGHVDLCRLSCCCWCWWASM